MFPGDLLPSTYPNPDNSDQLLARSEVQRREEYIDQLHTQLGGAEHSLAQMVKQCLHNSPSRRPSAEEVLGQLEGMRTHEHLSKLEVLRVVEEKEREKQDLQGQLEVSVFL